MLVFSSWLLQKLKQVQWEIPISFSAQTLVESIIGTLTLTVIIRIHFFNIFIFISRLLIEQLSYPNDEHGVGTIDKLFLKVRSWSDLWHADAGKYYKVSIFQSCASAATATKKPPTTRASQFIIQNWRVMMEKSKHITTCPQPWTSSVNEPTKQSRDCWIVINRKP